MQCGTQRSVSADSMRRFTRRQLLRLACGTRMSECALLRRSLCCRPILLSNAMGWNMRQCRNHTQSKPMLMRWTNMWHARNRVLFLRAYNTVLRTRQLLQHHLRQGSTRVLFDLMGCFMREAGDYFLLSITRPKIKSEQSQAQDPTSVWRRSGPTPTISIGIPRYSSMKARYFAAFTGSALRSLTSRSSSVHPANAV